MTSISNPETQSRQRVSSPVAFVMLKVPVTPLQGVFTASFCLSKHWSSIRTMKRANNWQTISMWFVFVLLSENGAHTQYLCELFVPCGNVCNETHSISLSGTISSEIQCTSSCGRLELELISAPPVVSLMCCAPLLKEGRVSSVEHFWVSHSKGQFSGKIWDKALVHVAETSNDFNWNTLEVGYIEKIV